MLFFFRYFGQSGRLTFPSDGLDSFMQEEVPVTVRRDEVLILTSQPEEMMIHLRLAIWLIFYFNTIYSPVS
jgi:hypothetical protein